MTSIFRLFPAAMGLAMVFGLMAGTCATLAAGQRSTGKKNAAQPGGPYVRRVYDPFAGLDFTYTATFSYGQEIASNLEGKTRLTGEFRFGGIIWDKGGSFALRDGRVVVINGSGTKYLPGSNTTCWVTTDDNGKQKVAANSLAGSTQITAQSGYVSGNNRWTSGTLEVVDGEIVVGNGSFEANVKGAAGLDFTYRGKLGEDGKAMIDPDSLHGQTEIRGSYVMGNDVWTKGTFKVINGQLLVVNGEGARHASEAGSVVRYGFTTDESGKQTKN